MSKIFKLLLLTFLFFSNFSAIFADEKIKIYSREEW
jgi:hypothetical protein